jgi:hypothetical protein
MFFTASTVAHCLAVVWESLQRSHALWQHGRLAHHAFHPARVSAADRKYIHVRYRLPLSFGIFQALSILAAPNTKCLSPGMPPHRAAPEEVMQQFGLGSTRKAAMVAQVRLVLRVCRAWQHACCGDL